MKTEDIFVFVLEISNVDEAKEENCFFFRKKSALSFAVYIQHENALRWYQFYISMRGGLLALERCEFNRFEDIRV